MQKTALVTGAGSGIGRSVAFGLAAQGFLVVLAGRSAAALQQTVRDAAGACLPVPTDVTDPLSVNALFARIAAEAGRLDVLFNNAGLDVPGVPFDEIRFEDWGRILATNLTGQFLCAQGAFRLMKAQKPQGGRIINNGSVSAQAPRPNSAPYAASKHGVTGLTKALILDGRSHGITAAQIDIGNAAADPFVSRPPSRQADGRLEVEPFMSFDTVAAAVVFMASLPSEANVPFLTITASAMPLYGRG